MRLQNAAGDAKEVLGEELRPEIEKIVRTLTDRSRKVRGEALKVETLRGEAITRAGIDNRYGRSLRRHSGTSGSGCPGVVVGRSWVD